jgi:predicted aspartyl protease
MLLSALAMLLCYARLVERKAIVPVIFRLPQQPNFSVNFVIDTGFNDYLTLPPQAVSAMNESSFVFKYICKIS